MIWIGQVLSLIILQAQISRHGFGSLRQWF